MELVSMPVADLRRWFSELVLDDTESRVGHKVAYGNQQPHRDFCAT